MRSLPFSINDQASRHKGPIGDRERRVSVNTPVIVAESITKGRANYRSSDRRGHDGGHRASASGDQGLLSGKVSTRRDM